MLHFVLTYLVEISQQVKSSEGSEVSKVMINKSMRAYKSKTCMIHVYANSSVWLHVLEVNDCLLALLELKQRSRCYSPGKVSKISSHCSDKLICSLLSHYNTS